MPKSCLLPSYTNSSKSSPTVYQLPIFKMLNYRILLILFYYIVLSPTPWTAAASVAKRVHIFPTLLSGLSNLLFYREESFNWLFLSVQRNEVSYHPISWDNIAWNPLDLSRLVKFSPLRPNIELYEILIFSNFV